MNDSAYFIVVLGLYAVVFCAYFIKRQVTIRRNRFCPLCRHKMELQRRSRDVDPKKEPVNIGGTRMIAGKAREFWSVIHCSNCGYEIKL